MSLALICNAAEGLLQLALVRDDTDILCTQEWPAPTHSTEILAPALHHMLSELGHCCADITKIACVYGPGSFTGIRLVLTTAAALRRVVGAPVAALDYMQVLALSTHMALQGMPQTLAQAARQGQRVLWVLTHARRDLAHCQPFLVPESLADSPHSLGHYSIPQAMAPVALDSLEECARRINASGESATSLCVGTSLWRNHAFFTQHCPTAHFFGPAHNQPTMAALIALAQQASYAHEDIEPLYIRPCDAVDNLPTMAARMGRTAEDARHSLETLLQRPTTPDAFYK